MSDLFVVLICGLPGSGKSTLAEEVAKELRLPIFSVDPIESAVIRSGIKRGPETGLAAYLVAENLAAEHLKLGQSVIIDCVSAQEVAKDMWRNLAKEHKVKLIIVECVCPDKSLYKKRIEARVRNIHGIAEVTWDDVLKREKEYTEWQEPKLVIDTATNHKQNFVKALEYIVQES